MQKADENNTSDGQKSWKWLKEYLFTENGNVDKFYVKGKQGFLNTLKMPHKKRGENKPNSLSFFLREMRLLTLLRVKERESAMI